MGGHTQGLKEGAEKVRLPSAIFPRRLKPRSIDWTSGAAEAAPFQNNDFFSTLLKPLFIAGIERPKAKALGTQKQRQDGKGRTRTASVMAMAMVNERDCDQFLKKFLARKMTLAGRSARRRMK